MIVDDLCMNCGILTRYFFGDLHSVVLHGVHLALHCGRVDARVVGHHVQGLVHDLELVAMQVAAGVVRRRHRPR